MAFGSIRLIPGVDVVKTPSLNQAGISSGNLIRWREGLVEKIGGWERFYPLSIDSIPRELHAWQDINNVKHLGVGALDGLLVITDGNLTDITPQTTTTDTPPAFSATSGSNIITIIDSNIAGVTTNNFVFLATPVWVGGLVLSGLYAITSVLNTDTYQVLATSNATLSTTTSVVTITNTNPGVVTWNAHGLLADAPVYFTTTGALPTNITPNKTYFVIAAGLGVNSFRFSATPGGTAVSTIPGVQTGVQTAVANGGSVPVFSTITSSASVNVFVPGHNLIAGESTPFLVSTTVGGITISGSYLVQSVVDANNYVIVAATSATSTTSKLMNSGNAESVYYIALGPQGVAAPYGSGDYGASSYGIGSASPGTPGTPITATDWLCDNWGEILLSCPEGGAIYQWSPESGFQNGQIVANGPVVNTGMFVAMPYQIVVAFGSSFTGVPSPLSINWCTIGDFSNWAPTAINTAGGFIIPTGSRIVGGIQAPQQGLIWTDIDLYTMQFVGAPSVFGFTKISSGCGLIGSHAVGVLGNTIYWMSQQQFFVIQGNGGPQPLPCSVWDYVFQNLDTDNVYKIRCKPNSNFGTIGWEFPSKSSVDGENDSYVEYNTIEREWTTGQYPTVGRSAWIDQSVFGPPLAGSPDGLIFQHEVGYNGDGGAINPMFTTGFFAIGEGEDFYFLDQLLPDFKYGLQQGPNSASLQITLFACDFPNDTVRQYGPYTVDEASRYITTRLRGRLVSIQVQSFDPDSFWRLGLLRYRYSPAGRR